MRKILSVLFLFAFVASGYSQDITCCSTADLTATGGVAYTWSNGPMTATNPGVPAGSYTVTVTDDCGGTDEATFVVANYDPIVPTCTGVDNTSCDDPNGSVSVTVVGGDGSYSYSWTPLGGTNPTGSTYSDLSGGTYTVIVTDGCGNTGTCNVTIDDNTPPPTANVTGVCN